MKAKRLIQIVVAGLLGASALANDIAPGKEYYTAIKAANPIVLDGDLSEWKGAQILADPEFSIPKGSGDDGELVIFELHNGGNWSGPDDHTSAVQVVYDDDNVYFGFSVTDEYHENAANSAWNGDSVQLMIANEDRDSQIALYNYALGGVEGDIGDIIVNHEAAPDGVGGADGILTEAVIVRDAATNRTTYEIKLPKETLALDELKGGVRFGLGMAINDGDEDTPGQRGWGGLGAHSIVFGKSPSETALVTLATSNDIEPGKEYYFAGEKEKAGITDITLDGELNEWDLVPVLSDPRFSIPKGSGRDGDLVLFELHNGGNWNGPDDHTSAVQIVFDEENVYFGFAVTDEYHENSANSAWNGDSIQLMIANENQDSQVALYNYALGGVTGDIGEIIVNHEAAPDGVGGEGEPVTEAVVRRDEDKKQTFYEIKLPAVTLGLEAPLAIGMQFGLGMAINDGDEDTPGQRGWGGLGAHSIVFGKTPQQTALVTLGDPPPGQGIFYSSISQSINEFTFRVNDGGGREVDPESVKLTIDGQPVQLSSKEKVNEHQDFFYTFPEPFESRSVHAYTISMQDLEGNVVPAVGDWTASIFSNLNKCMMALDYDESDPGFLWRVFQSDFGSPANINEVEAFLAGELLDQFDEPIADNFAYNDDSFGPAVGAGRVDGLLLEFEIPTVINLHSVGLSETGNFAPDDQMPGVPGIFFGVDGAAAEIITFVEFPEGITTLGVNSDDGFRMEGGYIGDSSTAEIMGEQFGARGAGNSTFDVKVDEAGVYPIRVIWWNSTDADASIELYSLNADGEPVLLNDTDNGGLRAFRSGTAPVFDPDRDDCIAAPAPVFDPALIGIDFAGDGPNSAGSSPAPWISIDAIAQDETITLGGAITLTALDDGFTPNNPAPPGEAAVYDGVEVPSEARDDYLFKSVDAAGTEARMRIDGLPEGNYNVTVFEGRTTDARQVAKIWVGDEPANENTGDFAGGSATVAVSVAAGEALWYKHLEDGSGGVSGMIIRYTGEYSPSIDYPVLSEGSLSETTTIDIGNLSGDSTFVFFFNAASGGASTALAGNDSWGLKLDQWNNQGVFGTTQFGVADNLFEPVEGQSVASVFNEDVHVAIVNDTAAGEARLYVNGIHVGTSGSNIDLSGEIRLMGARIGSPVDVMGEGSVMYSYGIYDVALSGDEIAALVPISYPLLWEGSLMETTTVDIGDLSGDASFVFTFNAVSGGASTAIAGNDSWALKLDQWNNQGVFGTTQFGVADNLFEPVEGQSVASVFNEDVHVAFVNDTAAGQTWLYVNGVHVGTSDSNVSLSGEIRLMGARIGNPVDVMGEGSVMSSWGVYDVALSADEVAALASTGGSSVSIGLSDGQVTVTWESGTLQSAPAVAGPWTDVTDSSPHTEAASAAATFYRVME